MRTLTSALLFFATLLNIFSQSALAHDPINFNYCYENKEFYPHFTGNSLSVPKESPGASIEILQALDKALPEIIIDFHRMTWPRCLKALGVNAMQAVIGSHNKERESFGQYPRINGELATELAYSEITTCLVYHQDVPVVFNGDEYIFGDGARPTLAIPRGYSMVKILKRQGFAIYETDTAPLAHDLLINKRVEASISACDYQLLPEEIIINPVPLKAQYGYLILSKAFVKQHPKLSEKIWATLAAIDKDAFYAKYPLRN